MEMAGRANGHTWPAPTPGAPEGGGAIPVPSNAMARVWAPNPSVRAEERRARGGQGLCNKPLLRELACCGCLNAESEANAVSSAALPLACTAGCPERSAGTRTAGSPFFCVLFFGRRSGGEAKKRMCAAGRTSRPTALIHPKATTTTPSAPTKFASPKKISHSAGACI